MTQDCRARILAVQKLVEEEVNGHSERPESEVSNVLCKVESGKRDAEREMGECGLSRQLHHPYGISAKRSRLTSTVIPGTNIITANAWKNFRLALTLNVGNR